MHRCHLLTKMPLTFLLALLLSGCASPPKNLNDLCAIFREKSDWYEEATEASQRWSISVPIIMAFMYQESRFKATAKPPRNKFLWIFPGLRPSNSYGYSQALTSTWEMYQRHTENYSADRDDFEDAADFIGWYNHRSVIQSKIKGDDAYHLYLAYHEGHGGFNDRSFKNKLWLKEVAKKVSKQTRLYRRQLEGCEEELKNQKGFFGWF